ncbi:PTS sugar transporter subunit IIA [bacterium]|nr:PTS sugar transporter subunit IIA [bacterium]MBU1753989.1 PTS sugar transporter subunit IIA [bacterium]
MIGIVIATHGCMGIELLKTAELIIGKCENVEAVSFSPHESGEELTQKIKQAIADVNDGDGVVIFVDLIGGNCCTISGAFLLDETVEVLTGVNLPMIIKLVNHRDDGKAKDVIADIQKAGVKSIVNLREMIK